MKILHNMKKTSVTNSGFACDFCGRSFKKETTLFSHICETKRRYQDKDLPSNRIGFQTWSEFYKRNTASKKARTYLDFAKSAYYIAFVKFGKYCADVKCISVNRYVDFLLDNKIKIDSWASDTSYDNFLKFHLRHEDPLDALARSIETTIDFAEKDSILAKDYLRYGNKNRICSLIMNGKISPWMLYQSESGVELISNLDEHQLKMIMDYINPEQWAILFKRNPEKVKEVKNLLAEAGY